MIAADGRERVEIAMTKNPSEMSFRELRAYEHNRDLQQHLRKEYRWLLRYHRSKYDGRIWWDLRLPWWGMYKDRTTGEMHKAQKILCYCGSLGFRLTEFFYDEMQRQERQLNA